MSDFDFDLSGDQQKKRSYFKKSPKLDKQTTSSEVTEVPGGPIRQASMHLTHVDPWSVAKGAFVLGVTIAGVLIVATAVLWIMLSAAGVFEAVSNLWSDASGSTSIGINFLSLGRLLGLVMVISAIEIVLLTVLSTLFAVLYNLSVGFTGGIEYTFTDRN